MRRRRLKDDSHCEFIRQLPCVICGDNTSVECAHIRFSAAYAGKKNPGVGQKPSDFWVTPLCNAHHRKQHETGNELKFWGEYGIDPLQVAAFLYLLRLEGGGVEDAERLIKEQR